MPAYNDFEDEQQGSTNAPRYTAPSKQQEPQYTPWSSFVSANQDVSQREAGKLQNQVQGDVGKAQGDLRAAEVSEFGAPQALQHSGQGVKTASRTTPAAPTLPVLGRRQATGGLGGPIVPGVAQNNTQQYNAAPQAPQAPVAGNPPPAPWSSLAPQASSTPVATKAPAPAAPAPQPTQPQANVRAPDLQSAVGAQSWDQLLGDTLNATNEANALGSESGVQGLIQQSQSAPGNSAFDAALINGQGGPGFQKLSQQYGNGQLFNNVAQASQDANQKWLALQGAPKPNATTGKPPTITSKQSTLMGNRATPVASQSSQDWSEQDQNGWNAALQLGQQQSQKHGGNVAWDFTGGANDDSVDENGVIHVPRKEINGKFSADWNAWWGGGSNVDPRTLGLTPAELYALANVSPQQRAKWLKHRGTNG